MQETLALFDERYAQAQDLPLHTQPENWRTWEGILVDSNITQTLVLAAVLPNVLFRFEELRPDEGPTRQVGRITNYGIYIVIRSNEGLRALTSPGLHHHVMMQLANDPNADPIQYLLVNF